MGKTNQASTAHLQKMAAVEAAYAAEMHAADVVPAPANRPHHTCWGTLDTLDVIGPLPADACVHLDAAYDNDPTRTVIAGHGYVAPSPYGEKTPIQHGHRWIAEQTNSWGNNFGKLRRCTERRQLCVKFYLASAGILITISSLIQRAWYSYRWETRPRSPASDDLLADALRVTVWLFLDWGRRRRCLRL